VEDVSQEALVAVLRGLPSYRGDGAFRSWADRVVARTTFTWLRRRRQAEGRVLESSEQALEQHAVAEPDDYLQRRRLVGALDELPFEQRHTLVLHHVLEMTIPEVAEQTGVPFETVRSRLRLARRRLRDALTPTAAQKVS
jgi:RNA polymerase sigma-70 factor (ECF subfamily)